MKKLLYLALAIVLALDVNAIPAKPGKIRVATKDGSTIEVRLVGDEFHHNLVTLDGYIVKEKVEEGYYEVTNQRFDAKAAENRRMAVKSGKSVGVNPKSMTGTSTYTKGLVILVGFSDYAFTESNSGFTNLLNEEGYNYSGATGSVKDYFYDMSYGQYDPTFDVYGPYTLDKNMSYYGSNSGYYGDDAHADQMVVDAVAKLVEAEGENVLAQYDCDNDGYVDNVFVYYAGYAESSGAPSYTIWPHRYWVMDGCVTGRTSYGGKKIYDYACSSEYDGTYGQKRTGIGAFCHEFSHVLGLPDLYVTSSSYYSTPATPEDWDIMDAGCYNNNENTPPAYSAEERFYVGWLTPTVLNESGSYSLPNLNDTAKAFLISQTGTHNLNGQNPNPKIYYLFENRQKKGWDRYVPGHGMLVWKIQYSANKWEMNTVNNSANSMGCTIVSAKDPNNFVNRSASGADPFPGTRSVTSYSPYSDYQLSGISEADNRISFTLGTLSGVEGAEMAEEIVMFSVDGVNYTVDNLPEGALLRCYDVLGRMMWSADNVGTTYTFSNRSGMFVLQISVNGRVCVLKN